jgi:hypothetical protein
MQRVFIPQVTERFDQKTGRRVEAFDFTPAAQYGTLTEVLDRTDNPMFLARLTPKIRERIADFGEHDYLLAVGDPSVIGICCGLLLRRMKKLKMLKWDRHLGIYIVMELNP